ncbi:hypothetical protein F5878DRAFT_709897 [Lentinula raphanica]|uniref:Uncharacterized protein n=1 Tax=Lentinula raphanica TaxID=153919 RepID=A0AA38P9V2_9AGAR|nr:hypothetical protein F5878DRAFT_709897 [Lentinula raphanica]
MPHHDPISTSAGYLSDIGIQLLRSGTVTGATVLVELIWSNPFGLASIMFLVNRYAPFVDTFLSVNMSFNPAITAEQCAIQTRAVSWLMTIGIVHSELILMLRTYALWGRRRSILILLTFLAVGFLIPAIILTKLEVSSEHFIAFHGCHISTAKNIIFLAFCLLTVYETLRQTRSPWVTKLYKDGLVYYFYLLVLSCTNIVFYRLAPAFGPWLATLQRIMYSVFCNRVLFLIIQGNSGSAYGVGRRRDIETGSELPVVTLTEILETDIFEDTSEDM